MSYLFGTRGTAFWKRVVWNKMCCLSACLPLPGSFPRGTALQKGWFGFPQSFLSTVELWSQGSRAAWGALEEPEHPAGKGGEGNGHGIPTAAHPSCCIPCAVWWDCRSAQQSRSGEMALGAAGTEELGWRDSREGQWHEQTWRKPEKAADPQLLSGTAVGKGVEPLLNHPGGEKRRFACWFSSMSVSVCSFSVASNDCYPLWESWNWTAGVCLWGDLMVVWHLFTPCKVCLLAAPTKESVFTMGKLKGILWFIQCRGWGDAQGEGVENCYPEIWSVYWVIADLL